MPKEDIKIFSGTSNRVLAQKICEILGISLGISEITKFSDGEIFAEIKESVRGSHVFLIQSTSRPANHNLMELLIMLDTFRRASASEITAVIPYYGYARQDRKTSPRTPITAKLVADLLETSGATRVVSADLHAGQIQGFFNVPFDHLYCSPVLIDDIKEKFNPDKLVIVSPDTGGVERARAMANHIGVNLAIIDKRRPAPNQAKVMNIIGDIKGKTAILIDDMIDTAGTIAESARALSENGATDVHVYCSHAVFSGPAIERLESSCLKSVVATDTIPLSDAARSSEKIRIISIANLLAEAIKRINNYDSISSLFYK